MESLYTYYKAIRSILEFISRYNESATNINIIKETKGDVILNTNIISVSINEDWIDFIESKLDYIGQCIKEKRQFILRANEVTPVEKIKGVSSHTVKDLAKHANYIINDNDGELFPKKLLSNVKQTDFAVYENKFIYYLLDLLKHFIDTRYKAIVKYQNMYKSRFKIKKEINIENKRIDCDISFKEFIDNDIIRRELKLNEDKIKRIQDIYHSVLTFLNSPLMVEVSKVPMITPPITITNVLKMNQNFKEALSLYNYIVDYKGVGYVLNKEKTVFDPLPQELSYAYSFLIDLSSNITYLFTNDLINDFRKKYDEELEQNKKEKLLEVENNIIELKTRLNNNDISLEEYVIELEKNEEIFKRELNHLKKQLKVIDKLNADNDALNENIKYLNSKLDHAVNDLQIKDEQFNSEIEFIKEKNLKKLEDLNKEKEIELKRINEESNKINKTLYDNLKSINLENKRLNEELEKLKEENLLLKSQINIKNFKENIINHEDFLDEFSFKELEQQLKLLKKMTKEQWKHTKKQIKKEVKEKYGGNK